MALSTQSYKGSRDFYPPDKRIQNGIFAVLRKVAQSFGYEEYDGPLLEAFELYAAKSGTEIVNQQLYSFTDRGDRKVAIRPEMTPTLARMVAAKVQELPKPIRWFSIPNLWRYEKPQRGRLREHWQFNLDVLGGETRLADAELILVALGTFRAFGAQEFLSIHINNRRLMDHFFLEKLGLNAEQAVGVSKAIDAKNKIDTAAFEKWLGDVGLSIDQKNKLQSFLDLDLESVKKEYPCEGSSEISSLLDQIKGTGFENQVRFDSTIMRGLDYYTGTVFEAFDVSPENKRALFGGGRYDNLIGLFGKNKLSGAGFGLGDVTLRDFLETHKLLPSAGSHLDIFITTPTESALPIALRLATEIRAAGFRVGTALNLEGFGSQLKTASKLGARFVLLLGETELARHEVGLKNLSSGEQSTVAQASLVTELRRLLLNL